MAPLRSKKIKFEAVHMKHEFTIFRTIACLPRLLASSSEASATKAVYDANCGWYGYARGVYLVLFCICAYILIKHKETVQKTFLTFAVMMFMLASADMILTWHYTFRWIVRGEPVPSQNLYPKFIFYATNNMLADMLLIYRCYVVWGHNKRVIAFPAVYLLASTVCGYTFQSSNDLRRLAGIYLWMTFGLNILVTSLTAGRIWWISYKARAILKDSLVRKYNYAIALIVESGIIYSAYMLLDLCVVTVVLDSGLVQIVGIVPTLLIVQVGLGRESQNVQTNVSRVPPPTFRTASPVLDTFPTRSGTFYTGAQSPVIDIRRSEADTGHIPDTPRTQIQSDAGHIV